MNKNFIKYLFNISILFIVSALILILILAVTNKYQAKLIGIKDAHIQNITYYEDLDFDGETEQIEFTNVKSYNYFTFYAYTKGKTIEQWAYKGQIANAYSPFFSDYDNDKSKELFILFRRNDSVFLNIIDIFNKKIDAENIFISKVYKTEGVYDYGFKVITAKDINKDGYKEIFLNSTAAYSKRPRRTYSYFPLKDTIFIGPKKSCISTMNYIFFDIDNDKVPEIFTSTMALGNCKPEAAFSDMYSWFMVFTPKMEFKFPPVRFDAYPSETYSIPMNTGKNKYILVIHIYKGVEKHKSFAALYNIKGKLIRKKVLQTNPNWSGLYLFSTDNNFKDINILLRDGNLLSIDSALNITQKTKLNISYPNYHIQKDIDKDGEKEIIFRGDDMNSLVIYRKGFKYPVKIPLKVTSNIYLSVVKTENKKSEISIKTKNFVYYYTYQVAWWHQYKFLLFLIIFSGILLMYYIIREIIKYQKLKKENTQKKITALQIEAIQNQINPYFTYQIVSSFEKLIDSEDIEYANYLFDKYVLLLRKVLINAQQIQISLEEELNFVQSYLEIERYRLSKKLDYKIEIDEKVNKKNPLPRMLLHIFLQDSLNNIELKSKAKIFIKGAQENGSIKILLEENIQREKQKNMQQDISKIVDNVLNLYQKLYKTNIVYKIKQENKNRKIELNIPVK